jgi:hypothetical protein
MNTKEQSKQWVHTHSPNNLNKFKKSLPARKLMTTVLWERKGVLMVKFVYQGTTITSQVYCQTLKIFHSVIQDRRRGMLTYGVVLLYDNERPHTAARTRAFQLGTV